MKSTLAVCPIFFSLSLLAGCASKPTAPAPRAAVVVEQRDASSGYERTVAAVQSGRSAVLGGLMKHAQNGGSMRPWSIGPAVGGLVEDGKAGVADSCTQQVVVRFDDTSKEALINTRCGATFAAGQRVTVVFSLGKPDIRDAVQIVATE